MLKLHSYRKLLLVLAPVTSFPAPLDKLRDERKKNNLQLCFSKILTISLVILNFNLQAQLISGITDHNLPTNNLQAQIDQLQDQLDYLRQNLTPRVNNNNLLAPDTLQASPDFAADIFTEPITFTQHPFSEDFAVNFFTNLQVDYFTGHALELFNRNSYDDYMFTQGALDFGIDIAKIAGLRHHELFFDIRAKGIFGNSGIFNGTVPRPIKIGLGRTENSYSFQPALQNLWLRELWFKYNINPQYHTDLQIGFFPYAIGSGLTLGNGYKVGKLIPGYYEERFVDQFRPGIMLTGDLWPEKLKYKIYAGLRANCSSNFYDTAQFTYSQDPNWRDKPERGSFFNNTVGAFEIEYHSERKNIQTDVRPYIIINQENFQQVEFPGDASSTLGILGINVEAKKDHWSFFFESALNFGSQNVKAWDRDFVEFISKPTHMYLFQDFNTTTAYNPCWKQAITAPCPESTPYHYYNGQQFKDSNGTSYKNAFDRYRQAYQNNYHGLMFYTEAAYHKLHPTKPGVQTTFAMAAGYASGDENPNDSFEKLMANRLYGTCGDEDTGTCIGYTGMKDYNKQYNGFVGVDQMFMNRDVYSVFMLESQKLNRPLATSESRLTYPLFTNLAFLGLGAKYDQVIGQERAFTFRFNALTYWQAEPTNKGYNYGLDILFALGSCGYAATNCFTPQLKADACKTMSQHLGSEINCAINYQFDQNLNFYCSGAAFIPGSYYRDIAGKIIPLEVQYQLASVDYSGYEMNQNKYDIALDNSTALIFNIGFGYSFDTAPKQRAVFSKELQANLATLTHSHVMPVTSADTAVNQNKLIIKPVSTQVTLVVPALEHSPKLSIAELELLETLQYKTPALAKPVTLTRTTNLNNPAVQTPKVTTPSTYALPKANSLRHQAPVTQSNLQLTVDKSLASIITPEATVPSTSTINHQNLPSARPEVYRGMLRAQPITLTTAPTNSISKNTLALPMVSAINLTIDLAPVTKLKYQAPVTRQTKLVTTKPTATQIATPITARSPRLSMAELELLATLQYQIPVCAQSVTLTRAINLNNQAVQTPKVTTPSTYALPKANSLRHQAPVTKSNLQLTVDKSLAPIVTPEATVPSTSTINHQNLPSARPEPRSPRASVEGGMLRAQPITLTTAPTNSISKNTLALPMVSAINLTIDLAPVTKLKYQAPVTRQTKLVTTKPTATQIATPITEHSPRLAIAELELLELLQSKTPALVKPVTLTSAINLNNPAVQTPKVTTPSTYALPKANSLRHQAPVTKSNSQLTVDKSHASIVTPKATVLELATAPKLEIFEYQVATIKPVTLANNSKIKNINLPNTHTHPASYQKLELEVFEYQAPKVTKFNFASKTKSAPTNNFTLPAVTIIKAETLPELEPLKLRTAKSNSQLAITKSHVPIVTPEATIMSPASLNLRTSNNTSAPAVVPARKSRADFEDSNLNQRELELLESYKRNFAI